MSYFKHMPATIYRGDQEGQLITALDITVRAKILEYIRDSAGTVVDYIIRDGERPEHLAHRVYGESEYHWINLLYNEIHDPLFEWPLSSHELEKMVDTNYPGRAYFIDANEAFARQSNFYFEAGSAKIGNLSATIIGWEPNLYKIVVDIDSPGEASVPKNSKIIQVRSDGKEVSATIERVVSENKYSVHHFVDQDTNRIVDHHAVNNDTTLLEDLGPSSSGEIVENISIIQRYVLGENIIPLDNMTIVSKSNYEHEIERNDAKRTIKVMRPEFVDTVVRDLQKVFLGG